MDGGGWATGIEHESLLVELVEHAAFDVSKR